MTEVWCDPLNVELYAAEMRAGIDRDWACKPECNVPIGAKPVVRTWLGRCPDLTANDEDDDERCPPAFTDDSDTIEDDDESDD